MHEEAVESGKEKMEFITFVTGGQNFCVDIKAIREIRRWTTITKLPHSDAHILGVMNLRGAVIPIVDLSSILGLGTTKPTTRHVTIIVSVEGRTNGLLVESVSEILSAETDTIQEAPRVHEDQKSSCIQGIIPLVDDIARIINLESLLANKQEFAA